MSRGIQFYSLGDLAGGDFYSEAAAISADGLIDLFEAGELDPALHYRVTVEIRERRVDPPGTTDINDTTIAVRSGDDGLALVNSGNVDFFGADTSGKMPIYGCACDGIDCRRVDVELVEPFSNLAEYTLVFDLQTQSATATVFNELEGGGDSLTRTPDGVLLDVSQGLAVSLPGNPQHESDECLGLDIQV